MAPLTNCRLCDRRVQVESLSRSDDLRITCAACGTYLIPRDIALSSPAGDRDFLDRRYWLSALAKAASATGGPPLRLTSDLIAQIRRGEFTDNKTVAEKTDLMLRLFEERSTRLGARVKTVEEDDYPSAFCRSREEWNFLLLSVASRGLIKLENGQIQITAEGWEWLESRPKASGSIGFIAMRFREGDDPVHAAIRAAVASTGYEPCRIDREEYIGGVMDQIIARIRESRFVVADFTDNRGGVYYEAGFARGLNVPVIPICRRDHLDLEDQTHRLHFDVRHLNFLDWISDDLPTLTQRLHDRIVALFGRGPVRT